MEIFPLLFWLLLVGAAACVILLRFRPAWMWLTAVSFLGLTLLGVVLFARHGVMGWLAGREPHA